MDAIQKSLLEQVADLHTVPEGAYNIRANGTSAGRNTTANIDIVTKPDKDGIDIIIISHQERILNIADKIVVLANGQVTQVGSKDEVLPALLAGTGSVCSVLTDKL